MKQKNRILQIVNFVKSKPLYAILTVSIVLQLIIASLVGVMEWTDSPSYYSAGELLTKGEFDTFRTPTYPLFFAIAGFISGSLKLWIVAFIQVVLFYLSVITFYKVCGNLRLSRPIIIITTCVYAFCPRLLYSNMMMMTESLAVSFCVFLVYIFIKWHQDSTWKNSTGLVAISIFLIFLRPTFLFLIVAIGILSLFYLLIKQYHKSIQLLIGVILSFGLLFGYSKNVESKTGVFTPSIVSVLNDVTIALNNSTLKSENISNPDIRQRVLDFEKKGTRQTMWDGPDFSGIPLKTINKELTLLKDNKIDWYIKTLKSNITGFISSPVISINYINIFITFGELSAILISIFIYICVYIAYSKKFPMVAIFLWLICVGNLFVNLLGSYAEWERLFRPSIPIMLLLFAQICNKFIRFKYQKDISIV